MSELEHLISANRRWANAVRASDPDFFSRLAQQQAPQYLWIGCSDSRVPANQIVGLLPGEIFVHRNVANVVVHADLNCLSVLQFAVDVLKVKHVIVCGHQGCSGVIAAWRDQRIGLADNWLRHVQDVRNKHAAWLDSIEDEESRVTRLCELNVLEQVVNVCQTTVVQDAWSRSQELTIHGWVYRLEDGLVRDLKASTSASHEIAKKHEAGLAALMAHPSRSA
jgi:carbonic anhydrase